MVSTPKSMATFLVNSWVGMKISSIIKVKILVLIKQSYRSLQSFRLLNLKYLSCWTRSPISLNTHVFLVSDIGATPNHMPLTYRCPIRISNWIRHVYLHSLSLDYNPCKTILTQPQAFLVQHSTTCTWRIIRNESVGEHPPRYNDPKLLTHSLSKG